MNSPTSVSKAARFNGLPTVPVGACEESRIGDMSKRVLFIYPWPLDEANGARAALVCYARALVRRGLTVDCFAPSCGLEIDSSGLYLGVFDRIFSPARTARTLQTLLNAAGAGCLDQALPSQHGCDPAAMFAAAAVASYGGYDLIGVHYTRLHAIRPLLPRDVPVVMFTYDLDAIVAEQESLVFGTPGSRYTLAMEAERLIGFDAVTTVGPQDRDRLRQLVPELPVYSAPIPVPVTARSSGRESSGLSILLMSSSASFHELSLAWFLTHAWPHITSAHPRARLLLAGRICDTARRFGADRDPHIKLLGTVGTPMEAFDRADVVIAPYYFGDGVKVKVLEAMAHGLPVVTTTPGLSNTELVPERDVLVADDGPAFAAAVNRLIGSAGERRRLSCNALRFIERHHSEAIAERALQELTRRLLDSPRPPEVDELTDSARTQRFVSQLQMSVAAALDVPTAMDDSQPQSHLVTQLRVLVPWAIHRVRASGARSIALFGAGTHTRLLLPMWRALDGPTPHTVVVSSEPAEPWCGGLPVVSLDNFHLGGTDAVVLSSHGYEHAMTAAWQTRFPNVPVFSIWSPPAVTGSPSVMPPTAETIPVAPAHAETVHR